MFTPWDLHASSVGWHLTEHAKQRATSRGVRIAQVIEAVTQPDLTYPDRANDGGRTIVTRGRLAVVTDQGNRTVLTVLLTGEQTWDDADARAVFASGT